MATRAVEYGLLVPLVRHVEKALPVSYLFVAPFD